MICMMNALIPLKNKTNLFLLSHDPDTKLSMSSYYECILHLGSIVLVYQFGGNVDDSTWGSFINHDIHAYSPRVTPFVSSVKNT